MSDKNLLEREIRSRGAHPEKIKTSDNVGLDGVHEIPTKSQISRRKHQMTGEGLFDEQSEIGAVININQEPSVQEVSYSELVLRKLKFKAGTKLYKFVSDPNREGAPKIPYSEAQEEDLFDRELRVPTYLNVPAEYLEIGIKGKTITRKVGQSAYGAFTVVLVPITGRDGEVILERRLASYISRSRREKI